MRISDWSSDVCSSDLPVPARAAGGRTQALQGHRRGLVPGRAAQPGRVVPDPPPPGSVPLAEADAALRRPRALAVTRGGALQRQRRSEERRVGKSVSVRVDLGDSRIIKKKIK